ncbi:GCG_CRPN prefix-to-repeats domain-containing protein [Methylocystis echinoides]|jgi:hypothetical protein|uniref:Uncharacterized protein n=1 Tax=Methylocystis echinoides TaxID=29468 RepID=A0A9W6GZD5_9HYPH|nr:hypothetical protein [Methylocystis echinoides]GLI95716.1 hypothetical protein LMG27198_47080 [Methylocystis echinoides]
MKTPLKFGYVFAVAIASYIVTSQTSRALPVDITTTAPAHIERADWACGPGWHVDAWGRCDRNHWGSYGYGYSGWNGGWNDSGWQRPGYGGYPGWQSGGYYARPVRHRRWDDDDDD